MSDYDLKLRVTEIIRQIGIPANILGYGYIREAIITAVGKTDILNYITKELYPSVAKKCATTPSRAERAIRHAIECAWERGDKDYIDSLFGSAGRTAGNRRCKPTNSEFIATIVDMLILEREGKDVKH